jgi:polysaccharide deacetylase family protein (PEP-CTERM system associated)
MNRGQPSVLSRNALAIHLEDWYHTRFMAPYTPMGRPEGRVAWAVEPILALLERHNVRATIFVLGDVLRLHPELVRRLYDEGHEIGCYGWRPRPVHSLAPELFAQDLAAFDRQAAEVLPVQEIVGFRAPGFSLDASSSWALEALRRRGYRYDASIHPARTPWYGVAGAPLAPYRPIADEPGADPDDALWEFPPTVYALGGLTLPVAGGLGLRATPLPLLHTMLARVQSKGRPVALYLSPWETDLGTPIPSRAPLWVRAACRLGVRRALAKLDALLGTYAFGPLRETLGLPPTRASAPDIE